jgi:nitrite reductase (cytochrome c-552)
MFSSCKSRTAEVGNQAGGKLEATSSASIQAGTDIDSWLNAYPTEAAAWKSSSKMVASPSGYGGSIEKERSLAQSEFQTNYKGSAYAVSFKTIRGHVYSWEDISTTKRVTDKTSASCLTCKSPDVADWYKQGGWDFARKSARSMLAVAHPAIDCFSCHDPATHVLRTTVPSFAEAMKRRGIDLAKATPKEMETYVCAQCHSTYYVEPKTNRIVAPWDKGLDPESMLAYYKTKPSGFEQDFVQPDSRVKVLKARHPDYELFSSSIHASLGISCADCHMPYVTVDGKRVRDHDIRSPLLGIQASCLTCHHGRTVDWIRSRVAYIQDSVFGAQRLAGQRLAATHTAIATATAQGVSQAKLEKARADLRDAQWYWDYVASANSMGFHNPELAMRSIAKAIDLAAKAGEDLVP